MILPKLISILSRYSSLSRKLESKNFEFNRLITKVCPGFSSHVAHTNEAPLEIWCEALKKCEEIFFLYFFFFYSRLFWDFRWCLGRCESACEKLPDATHFLVCDENERASWGFYTHPTRKKWNSSCKPTFLREKLKDSYPFHFFFCKKGWMVW